MNTETGTIEEPRVARLLFSDPRFGWLWLPLRLYLGYMWFEAGWHKFVDPKWMGSGEALLEYWKRGLKMTPKPAIAFDWYRSLSRQRRGRAFELSALAANATAICERLDHASGSLSGMRLISSSQAVASLSLGAR